MRFNEFFGCTNWLTSHPLNRIPFSILSLASFVISIQCFYRRKYFWVWDDCCYLWSGRQQKSETSVNKPWINIFLFGEYEKKCDWKEIWERKNGCLSRYWRYSSRSRKKSKCMGWVVAIYIKHCWFFPKPTFMHTVFFFVVACWSFPWYLVLSVLDVGRNAFQYCQKGMHANKYVKYFNTYTLRTWQKNRRINKWK